MSAGCTSSPATTSGSKPTANSATKADTVDLHLRGGEPDAFSLLAVVAVDGNPVFHPLAIQRLDTNGEATFTATVPPGLSGHTVSTQAWTTRTITQGPPKDSSPATIEVL